MKALLAIAAAAVAAPVLAEPPKGVDAHVESLRREIGAPGIATATVEKGRVTEARGFGVRGAGGSEPVDAATLFCNGSTTKAFTVAALAQLVDQGKLRW